MFPRTQPLEWRPVVRGEKNAVGIPVDIPGEWTERFVISISPPGKDEEPPQANRKAIVRRLDILDAPDCPIPVDGQIRLDGDDREIYDVVGHPNDYTRGPWDFRPGVRVSVERVEEAGDRGPSAPEDS